MTRKRRVALVWLLCIVFALTAAAVATAANKVQPVTNLHLVSGSATQVKIAWDIGPQPNLGGTTIDKFIIRRDGRIIATLVGFNGLVDTSYIDGDPSPVRAVYSVVAVDSTGSKSVPSTVSVAAPQAAPQQNQPATKSVEDGIQSSNLCQSIIPPNVRGNNQPTAFEMYGCGKGMNAVNDSKPDTIGVSFLKTDKPRPIHDFIQNFFIQLPVTRGQTFFLLISAFATWVTLPSTYLGVGQLFAGMLQTFNGNPNRPGLIALALALGLVTLTLLIVRSQYRKGYITAGMYVAVLAILVLFLSNPFRTMQTAVDKPLSAYTAVANETSDMVGGTAVDSQFNLTVKPTFDGNKSYNAIRKDENNDWLMFQYLPQCAINFGDFRWSIQNKYPGSSTTWCEKFVQVWGVGDDNAKQDFMDKLKTANPDVFDFFNGGDQGQRVLMSIVSKSTLLEHNLLKFGMKASLYVGLMLLLAELVFAVIWLIALLLGTDSTKLAAQRRLRTMFHWLKVPFLLLLFMLVIHAVEAAIINDAMGDGFLWMTAKLFIFDLIAIMATLWYLKKEHHEHKQAMDRLGTYRDGSGGLTGRAKGYGEAALAATTGGAGYLAGKLRKDHSGDGGEDEERESTSSEDTFAGFDEPVTSNDGGDGYDDNVGDEDIVDGEWKEVPLPQLVMATSSGSEDSYAGDDNSPGGGDFYTKPDANVGNVTSDTFDEGSAGADSSANDNRSLGSGDFRTKSETNVGTTVNDNEGSPEADSSPGEADFRSSGGSSTKPESNIDTTDLSVTDYEHSAEEDSSASDDSSLGGDFRTEGDYRF